MYLPIYPTRKTVNHSLAKLYNVVPRFRNNFKTNARLAVNKYWKFDEIPPSERTELAEILIKESRFTFGNTQNVSILSSPASGSDLSFVPAEKSLRA